MSTVSSPQSQPIRFDHAASSAQNASASAKVVRIYQQVLKRRPDPAGLEHYRQLLEDGTTDVKSIVGSLLQSDEWKIRFIDGRPVQETALALYDCVLARAPDVGAWNQVTSWEPRHGWKPVMDGLLDSAEYDERFGPDLVPGDVRPLSTA